MCTSERERIEDMSFHSDTIERRHSFSVLLVAASYYLVVVVLAIGLLLPVQGWTSHYANTNHYRRSHWSLHLQLPSPSSRRDYIIASSRRGILSFLLVDDCVVARRPPANAFSFFFDSTNNDRRQKELCIVNLLRLQYWAQTISSSLESSQDIERRKKGYLEARLGAKAIVAKKQKVGGGATAQVFLLVSLGIKGCLDDLTFYAKDKKKVEQLKEDLTEALASIVEFDGLETTQDPSPRSSLTLGQFNNQKAQFVRRMLSERIVPLTQELIDYFGAETRAQCEAYVREYYRSELPPTSVVAAIT